MFGPDGYRYGVRFDSDGSVASYWNGATQKRRAGEYLAKLAGKYRRDRFTLVRRRRGDAWEECPSDDL